MRSFSLSFVVAFILFIGIASACSCIPPMPVSEALEESPAVFLGTVIGVDSPKNFISTSEESVRVTFNVSRAWKGVDSDIVMVRTARGSASCGYEFEKGKEYIVYTNGEVDDLKASLCSRTSLASESSDFSELGDGYVPEHKSAYIPEHGVFGRFWSWIMKLFG